MKNLTLTAGQRLGLGDLLGNQEGSLGKLLPFHRIMTLIRIDEEEGKEMEMEVERTPGGGTTARWRGDIPGRDFTLEDSDAAALSQLLEDWQHFKQLDLAWVLPIRDALRGNVL